MKHFPIYTDISHKKIWVMGGGQIAERRITTLLSFDADITIFAPSISEVLHTYAAQKKIRWIPVCLSLEVDPCPETNQTPVSNQTSVANQPPASSQISASNPSPIPNLSPISNEVSVRNQTPVSNQASVANRTPDCTSSDFSLLMHFEDRAIPSRFFADYLEDDMPYMVLSLTDDRSINHAVVQAVKKYSILVNVCDCPEECDFFFPAIIEHGNITASITAHGSDHKLVRKLATQIRELLHREL